jgi:hypothetical protein
MSKSFLRIKTHHEAAALWGQFIEGKSFKTISGLFDGLNNLNGLNDLNPT